MNKHISRYQVAYCGDVYTLERVPGGYIIFRDRGPFGITYLCSARRPAVWWDRIPVFKWTKDRKAARVYQYRAARMHWYYITGDGMAPRLEE